MSSEEAASAGSAGAGSAGSGDGTFAFAGESSSLLQQMAAQRARSTTGGASEKAASEAGWSSAASEITSASDQRGSKRARECDVHTCDREVNGNKKFCPMHDRAHGNLFRAASKGSTKDKKTPEHLTFLRIISVA